MNLVQDFLRASAERAPDKVALICREQIETFAQLERDSDCIACELQRVGVSRGDRVAVFVDNSVELVVSVFGILKAGGVFVMINSTTKERKLAYIMNDCQVRAMVAQPHHVQVVTEAVSQAPSCQSLIWTAAPPSGFQDSVSFPELREKNCEVLDPGVIDQDLCTIIYTSGTTGRSKGVMLTHQNVVSTARSIAQYLDNVPEDIVCCVLPLAFSYGLYQVFVLALVGHTLLLESSFAYPVDVLRRMERHKVTGFAGVPGIYATILQVSRSADLRLPTVRYLTNAAGPMSPAHIKEMLELFPHVKFYSMHGQTECGRTCYMDPDRLAEKPASVGKAMPNTELYLVDEDGCRVGTDEVGEMVVRGANVMRGYWNMPEATASKLREGAILGEKVLLTGDLFRADKDGDLFFVSRTDDIIKCRGEKVSPKEVEDVLHELDAVAEAAVVGVDDPVDGQAVKAFLVLREAREITEQQVRLHCRARLESHLVPKLIEICESLPKTESGKLKRRGLTQSGSVP